MFTRNEIDLAASTALLGVCGLAGVSFLVLGHRSRHARAEADGGSALLGVRVMHAFYWALGPLVRAAVALRISANAVTGASFVLALGAGVLVATGHLGLAALVIAASALCDALDGLVARESGRASSSGEVLDAAVDRYGEFFFLGGLAVHFRAELPYLLLTLAALLASLMVSYATAKAEAMHVEAPRGAMRRAERAVYLTLAAALTPLTTALAASWALPQWTAEAPILGALALVALVGNVSAVRRLSAVAASLRARDMGTEDRAPVVPRRSAPHGLGRTLLKFHVGSLMATVIDFGTMTLLVESGLTTPVRATIAGASLGGLANFLLARGWIFRAGHHTAAPQAARYAAVSAASALFNALGEYVVHDALGIQYLAARALVAIAVSLAWNFPMQRHFVFAVRLEER